MSSFLTNNNSTAKLAYYLKDFLNAAFEKEREASNGEIPDNTVVVRGVENYDAVNVPLTEFPLLKVYKNRDIYKKGTSFRTSEGAITYSVSYPQLEVLPNLLDWVSWQINYGLLTYERTVQDILPPINEQGYIGEHLLTANEQLNTVYPFLRFSINFKNYGDKYNVYR